MFWIEILGYIFLGFSCVFLLFVCIVVVALFYNRCRDRFHKWVNLPREKPDWDRDVRDRNWNSIVKNKYFKK